MAKKWWTLLAVCSGTFMLLLDTTIVYVAMPTVQRQLHASFADVQWVIDAYALTLAALLLTAGTLADKFGRRRLYAIGVGIFTVGSLLCGSAQSPIMLILSRVVQGIGGAFMFANGLALLAGSFQGKERGTAFGVWGMVTGIASAVGPIAGGLITSGISWRGIFLVNVPIGAAVVVMAALRVDESKSPYARKLDWTGLILFTTGLASLIYGLIRVGETSWGDSAAITAFISAAVLLGGFLIAERRVAEPMFDLGLFRIPTFVGGSISAFAMNGSLFAMFLFLALYFQEAFDYSALGTGIRFLIPSVAMFVGSILAGRLSGRVPVRFLIGPGLGLVGIGLLLMGQLTTSTQWTHFIAGFVVSGIGAGIVNPPLASTAVGVVDPSRSGMASGVNSTFRQVGNSSAVAVLGSLFAAVIGRHLTTGLAGVPELTGRAADLTDQVRAGQISGAIASTPAHFHDQVGQVIKSGLVAGTNDLLLITAAVALVGAVFAVFLIRPRDFVGQQQPAQTSGSTGEPAVAKG